MKISGSKTVIWLFAIALLARLLVFGGLLYHYGPGSFYLANYGAPLSDNDSQNYVTIAKNLVEHHSYSRFAAAPFEPDSFRTPLLVFYFVPFIYLFGFFSIWLAILVLDVILAGTAVLAYYFAKLFTEEKYAIWAGLLVALEPLLVYRSNIAEPDALVVSLLLAAAYCFVLFWREQQSQYLYSTAVFLGLATLAKPIGLYVIYLVAIFTMFRFIQVHSTWKRNHRTFFGAGCIVILILAPWLVRNHRTFGAWSMSSVQAYNFYYYYTGNLRLPNETVPDFFQGRDPIRNLRYEKYLLNQSFQRIKSQPGAYVRQHLVGTVRNLFTSDFVGFYNNGHEKLLPMSYNPVNKVNLTKLALAGNYRSLVKEIFSSDKLGFLLRHAAFAVFYGIILLHWGRLYYSDRETFWLFAFFLVLSFYFVFSAGTFVDAKYRLPAVPLLLVMFFHFLGARQKGASA